MDTLNHPKPIKTQVVDPDLAPIEVRRRDGVVTKLIPTEFIKIPIDNSSSTD